MRCVIDRVFVWVLKRVDTKDLKEVVIQFAGGVIKLDVYAVAGGAFRSLWRFFFVVAETKNFRVFISSL